MRDGNRENGKRRQKQSRSSTQYTWPSTISIQNLKTPAQIETEIYVIDFLLERKSNEQIMKKISTMY